MHIGQKLRIKFKQCCNIAIDLILVSRHRVYKEHQQPKFAPDIFTN
jgi:hypothetical protein